LRLLYGLLEDIVALFAAAVGAGVDDADDVVMLFFLA